MPEIERVWKANMQVYGADKVWRQLGREGRKVTRCTVKRLMRRRGLQAVRRGKVVRMTVGDSKAARSLDRVKRQFCAERPNMLWVSDFTYVSTWQAGSMSSLLSTSSLGASWAGGSAVRCEPPSFWMLSSRPCTHANPSATAA